MFEISKEMIESIIEVFGERLLITGMVVSGIICGVIGFFVSRKS